MSNGYKSASSLSEIELLESTKSTINRATRHRSLYRDLYLENPKVKQIWRAAKGGSWRTTVTVGAILASLVLVANVVVLVWSCFTLETIDGVALAFQGPCAKSERITVWAHFGINVLSTLLLSASNNCAQLLSSPSRRDIDCTHASGDWMNVGHAPSLKNIKFLPKHRTALILVLLLSSIPLHLLYNSVVFNTVSANAYRTVTVTEDFVTGPSPNRSDLISAYDPATTQQILNLYDDSSHLTKLGAYECIQAYRPSFISEWGDVLLVTNGNWNGSWPDEIGNTTQYIPGELGWDWINTEGGLFLVNLTKTAEDWTLGGVSVEHCLAKPLQPRCKVKISVSLLLVVIVCNALKLLCLLGAIYMETFEPLATVGDAIASFLDSPEPRTSRMGAVSAADVYKGLCTSNMAGMDPTQSLSLVEKLPVVAFRLELRKWGGVPSVSTWLSFSMGCGFAVIAAVLALVAWSDELSTSSLNTFTTQYLVGASSSWPLLGNVVFANSPQLLISLLYLSSNRILTTMLTAHECGKFAGERRALRVSKPRGDQRSTFWLQLPYRYILPLMATTAVLHWLMSRSLYFVDVEGYNDPSHPPGWRVAFAAGYSVLGISITLFIAVGICLALVALACRSLNPGIPVMSSCSLALSAACHPLSEESDVAAQKLMYGVLASTSGDARLRVGFSSKSVESLEDDVVYS